MSHLCSNDGVPLGCIETDRNVTRSIFQSILRHLTSVDFKSRSLKRSPPNQNRSVSVCCSFELLLWKSVSAPSQRYILFEVRYLICNSRTEQLLRLSSSSEGPRSWRLVDAHALAGRRNQDYPSGSCQFLARFRQNVARFRLYRHRFVQVNMRFAAYFKIYQIIKLKFSKFGKILQILRHLQNFCWIFTKI